MTNKNLKIVTITKTEFSKLTKGSIGTSKQNLTTKFKKNGANFKFEVNFLDSNFFVEFDEKGDIILELSQYKKLEKIFKEKIVEKTSSFEVFETMNNNLLSEFIILKKLTEEGFEDAVNFFEHLNNKLNTLKTVEANISINLNKTGELANKIETFYEETEKYKTDIKNIYQENLKVVMMQTNAIIGATKVIIDKSEKQQKYEAELVECRKKIEEYEEKSKQGIFERIRNLKK